MALSIQEANRIFFDGIGTAYDNKPWVQKFIQQLVASIQERLEWIGLPAKDPKKEIRLLDYACGTGLMSWALASHVSLIRGIDISPGQITLFNQRAEAGGLASKAFAVEGDLFTDSPDPKICTPEYFDYDFITVGAAFHHFEDPVLSAKKLKERLRPGGVLVITEFLENGDEPAGERVEDQVDNASPANVIQEPANHSPAHAHHGHGHGQGHTHHSHHHAKREGSPDPISNMMSEMKQSVKTFAFSEQGIRDIFTEAGYVDIDINVIPQKFYTDFAHMNMWKTIFLAKGTRPEQG